MIKFRPLRETLAEELSAEQEFKNLNEMFEHLVYDWSSSCLETPFSKQDLSVTENKGKDERCNWKETRYVCTKRLFDTVYDVPQCIGMCSIEEELKWSWNENDCDTWRNGSFDTREEAIKEACQCADYLIVYVGKCKPIPVSTSIDANRILDQLDENYCAETGCENYIYEDVTDEQREWLENKLSDLMNEFHKKIALESPWFEVVDIEEVDLSEYKEDVIT